MRAVPSLENPKQILRIMAAVAFSSFGDAVALKRRSSLIGLRKMVSGSSAIHRADLLD